TIIHQLKRMGATCDWARERFTMDEEYSKAVVEVFVSLYEKGLIYQGDYIINWCPRCQTALADEEAPHHDLDGKLYYIKYPIKEEIRNPKSEIRKRTKNNKHEDYVVVATTRPETMLGDTAVAVNPKDARYKHLIGQRLILPILEREILVIGDDMVDKKFGTGVVKVTPAHDPNDYAVGKRHKLEFINIMHPDGVLNTNAGDYAGMDRFEAREAIIEELKERKLLEKVEEHKHAVGHCYRCHTIVEPYLSKQWFVKMKPLAKPAIKAVRDGKINFYPKRWTKVYLNWMEDIRDWCISRQIWWGHRIPVYYCKKCQETASQKSKVEEGIIVSRVKPEKCSVCGSIDIYQDEDVLDTWFSSWLWPFATFGWPVLGKKEEQELAYFYPTAVLVTAQEIIFFWVARMIMAGMYFMENIPFKDVYIHGTVRDASGTKMSKSLGNVIDPLEIIDQYGCDALRFSIISLVATGQDVYLSKDKFESGRNFANKIWNAARYILTNLDREKAKVDLCIFAPQVTDLKEKWILSQFYQTLDKMTKSLENFRFNDAAKIIYEFFWHEFCDWYIELAKPTIATVQTQVVLYKILEKTLRILHPIMPYISEEIWQSLPHEGTSIMVSTWPHLQKQFIDKKADSQMETIIACVSAIRNIRSVWKIDPAKKIPVKLLVGKKSLAETLKRHAEYIQGLAKVESLEISQDLKKPKLSAVAVLPEIEIFVPLEGVIDVAQEAKRLKEQISTIESLLKGTEQKLKNKQFLSKAPKEIVEQAKEKKIELTEALKKLKDNLKGLTL
ncbi:MAG: valine--tRNA ligase, partial [Candidatus Omnitrophota bacterium]